MVLDPIPQSLPVHFFGSRPQPPTSRGEMTLEISSTYWQDVENVFVFVCVYVCVYVRVYVCAGRWVDGCVRFGICLCGRSWHVYVNSNFHLDCLVLY